MFNSLIVFFFLKACTSQVLKDFSVENLETVQFGLRSIRIFLLFFAFFFFLSVFSVKDTNVSQNSSEWRGNHYFSCFPRPSAHEYPFSFSRLLPLLFNWSICNYQTDNWWGLLISIFIDAVKSDLTFIFQCDIVRIWSHIKLSLFY